MPKWLVVVTPLSKAIALSIFIIFPIIGFILGYKYGRIVEKANILFITPIKTNAVINKPIPTAVPFKVISQSGWKTFTSKKYGYSFKYPSIYSVSDEQKSANDPNAYWIDIKSNKNIQTYGAKKEDLELWILVKPLKGNSSLESIGNDKEGNSPYEKQSNLTRTIIASEHALRWRTIDGPSITGNWINNKFVQDKTSQEVLVFIHNNSSYSIIKFPADTLRQNEFESILSSFKF